MIATRLTYILPSVTPTERKQIADYLDMLIESDRALTPQAAQEGLIETFALTAEQARYEYRHWIIDHTSERQHERRNQLDSWSDETPLGIALDGIGDEIE